MSRLPFAARTVAALAVGTSALALVAGPAGLDALEAIITRAPQHLSRGGWLLLEHGSTQHGEVASMLERRGFGGVETHEDFSGRPRVTLGNFQAPHRSLSG